MRFPTEWMNPWGPVFAAFLLLFVPLAVGANGLERAHVEGEVLVRFDPELPSQWRDELLSLLGGEVVRSVGLGSERAFGKLQLPEGETVASALIRYASEPGVTHVQPNYIYRSLTTTPDDPHFDKLWGLKNSNVDGAWGHVTDCRPIRVAVLDDGINYTHEDLKGNMWDGGPTWPNHGADFIEDLAGGKDPMPQDGDQHGSHVAGTIGAVGDNSMGITGVCQQATLMAVRVLAGGGGTTATVIAGIDYAVDQGAHIINMSLGSEGHDDFLEDALVDARERGVLVLAAAGNEGEELNSLYSIYPCAYSSTLDNVLCVAALDESDELADYSNYSGTRVNIAAPGSNIYSTVAPEDNRYEYMSGTSMAAPHVAGVAALVWSMSPEFDYLRVRTALMAGGRQHSGLDTKVTTGRALEALGAVTWLDPPTVVQGTWGE